MFRVTVGEYTYGHENINVICADDKVEHVIKIGKYCSIATNIKIYCGMFNHNYKSVSTFPFKELCNANCEPNVWGKSDPIIGNDVWLGANAVILPGVEIGNGAVVASYSIVSKSVPAYSIVAGNPAKVKKYRFNENLISELENIKWWDIAHDFLIENIIPENNNINEFIKKVNNYKYGKN